MTNIVKSSVMLEGVAVMVLMITIEDHGDSKIRMFLCHQEIHYYFNILISSF